MISSVTYGSKRWFTTSQSVFSNPSLTLNCDEFSFNDKSAVNAAAADLRIKKMSKNIAAPSQITIHSISNACTNPIIDTSGIESNNCAFIWSCNIEDHFTTGFQLYHHTVMNLQTSGNYCSLASCCTYCSPPRPLRLLQFSRLLQPLFPLVITCKFCLRWADWWLLPN